MGCIVLIDILIACGAMRYAYCALRGLWPVRRCSAFSDHGSIKKQNQAASDRSFELPRLPCLADNKQSTKWGIR
jgi:hypothetical protein